MAMVETVRIDREAAEYDVIPAGMSIPDAAEKVARGELKLSPSQQRMLIELLPFYMPKQSAVQHNVKIGFAGELERCVERSQRVIEERDKVVEQKMIEKLKREGKLIELHAVEVKANGNGNGQ